MPDNMIDVTPLRAAIEQFLLDNPDVTLTSLAHASGMNPRQIFAIRTTHRLVTLQNADLLCIGMQIPLSDVLPASHAAHTATEGWCRSCREYTSLTALNTCPWCNTDVVPGRKRGSDGDRRLTHISVDLLAFAYRLYQAGHSLRATAAIIFPRTTYATVNSCANSLHQSFRNRGWKLRSRREVLIARNTKHGLMPRNRPKKGDAGYDDYYALRRQQRKASGTNQYRRCDGYTARGTPCAHFAMRDQTYCAAHAPDRQTATATQLAEMRARSRANMTPWSTIAADVAAAIETYGRPALTRAAGLDPSVMGRMLRYQPDQLIRFNTAERLRAAITQLATTSETIP